MANSPRRPTKVRKAKVVIFDEENLVRTLHPPDKTYGFMEIDEPKTPHPSRAQPPLNSKDLRKRLEKLKDLEQVSSLSLGPDSKEDAASHHREQRRREFEERRKKSYSGEFLKAKEALKKLKDEEEPESTRKKI